MAIFWSSEKQWLFSCWIGGDRGWFEVKLTHGIFFTARNQGRVGKAGAISQNAGI
jgi:hypothetical protein